MLLSNLSKSEVVADKLLPRADLDDSTKLRTEFTTIGKLVDVFVRGESNKLNKFANYDHLSGVFANITKVNIINLFKYIGIIKMIKKTNNKNLIIIIIYILFLLLCVINLKCIVTSRS